FEKARKVLGDAEMVCVGAYYPDFHREKPRWQNVIKHYENIPTADLARLLRESTAFVFPSNQEGFAKAIAEAMGAWRPVIATHESGATTVVEDGVEGIIVPARNVDAIADAMIKVASDREMNERMGRASYASGASKNSWGDYADRLIKIFGERIEMLRASRSRG